MIVEVRVSGVNARHAAGCRCAPRSTEMSGAEQVQRKSIDGKGKTIREILSGRKFYIDYYQREYKWQTKQLEELISDLSDIFLRNFDAAHDREAVAGYDRYFLGSIIISQKDGRDYIIDGQQRLTTLTLLLLFLMKRQKAAGQPGNIAEMIYSSKYGKHSFNLDVPERLAAMQKLFDGDEIDEDELPESSRNIAARYNEIDELFPKEIDDAALPYFVDWLTENVHLVEITAYSDDVAYTIFETMNDRGLSLSPTDMLKGYLLANISDETARTQASAEWKSIIVKLRAVDPDGQEPDADFFKAWLRSSYADSIRERKKNARPEAWDRIGTEFHRWVRDEAEKLGLVLNGQSKSAAYREFILSRMAFYAKWYLVIRQAELSPVPGLENIYHNASHRFTHQPTLLLAPLVPSDSDDTIRLKLRLVAKYADIFLTRRLCNYRDSDYAILQYNVFTVVRDTRGLGAPALAAKLSQLLVDQLKEDRGSLDGFDTFGLNQWSHRPIKRILARMIDFVEVGSGGQPRYHEMMTLRGKKAFEIEHIWANGLEPAKESLGLEANEDFQEWRNSLGALLLLPKSFNASYKDDAYEEKVEHYFGQNVLAKALHAKAYENHPGFRRFTQEKHLPFRAHSEFRKPDLEERQRLYRSIADQIWDPAWIDRILAGERTIA